MLTREELKELFPNIGEEFEITSNADDNYSCVSWSVNDTKRYWWPYRSVSPYIYWPPGLLREETVEAFVALYEYCMFTQCESPVCEVGYDKVAIYALDDTPTHAARCWCEDRGWSSKLGEENDILHHALDALEGSEYGRVVTIMKRRRSTA